MLILLRKNWYHLLIWTLMIVYVFIAPGIFAQASLKYFHRPLRRDSLAQLALLAGLPQSPTLLDPLSNPEGAVERRAIVLEQMATDGYITWAQAHAADRAPAL